MTDTVTFTIQGVEELNKRLESISNDLKYKGGRFALRKAANIVRDKAIQSAKSIDDPATAESIANNITIRWSSRRFKRTGDLGFRIGVLGGAKGYAKASGEVKGKGKSNPGGDTYYWRFVEFGTQKFPAKPFMRPALADNTGAAMDEFMAQYGKALDRVIAKGRK